ncbi:MAG: phbC 1 [Hyphomicrobiales bacterium]|nr:phbC 1 [Hyphomicrobiales bacterium]
MDDRARPEAHARATKFATPVSRPPVAPFQLDALRSLDRHIVASVAKVTGGFSPAAIGLAFLDWAAHLASAPGRRMELGLDAFQEISRLSALQLRPEAATDAESAPELRDDERFRDDAWQKAPYRQWAQNFLAMEGWWQRSTHDVAGVSPHHEDVVSFAIRQSLDVFAPTNLPVTNPEVAAETLRSGGRNLATGLSNLVEDVRRVQAGQRPVGAEAFQVGRDVATTPGKVVFRNRLMELIQYEPATKTVHAEPILIVPAWIMKYYILDLSPGNSLIRHLVEKGHTVFCISWRNVTAEDRDLSLDDYRNLGVVAALDAVSAILPDRKIHAAGYCLGGTLLALAAAAMVEVVDERLASMTLFAAQTDFTEPGELQLFIDDSEVSFLESMMWEHGTLDSSQMAGAFQLLNSRDLVWSRMVHNYLMGRRIPMNDLMAWNADATRMPFRMHSEYLRKFFLGNDLASGRVIVDGRPIMLQNIRAPIFAVGTERDHVAPWQSVYKIHYLADTDVTFVLTNGGHNAGIVSEPGHPHRHFRIASKAADDHCLSADEWFDVTPAQDGSWWVAWTHWLAQHSSAKKVPPPLMGGSQDNAPLVDAPGTYVLQT